jgi:hypothetical protein
VKPGDLVMLDLGPQHPAQVRRAVPREAVVVNVDPPWVEVRAPGNQPLPVMTFLVPITEVVAE